MPTTHPDPDKKMFGFIVTFADGSQNMGLVVATCEDTARLQLENDAFACYAVDIIVDQEQFINSMLERKNGLVYFTTDAPCN